MLKKFYDEYYLEEELIFCELGDEYRLIDDAIKCEIYVAYATQKYINDRMCWSEYEQEYIKNRDSVYSEYLTDNLYGENSIAAYTDLKRKNKDYFPEHEFDNYFIRYYYDIEKEDFDYFSIDLVNNGHFIKVYNNLDKTSFIWLKTIDDKEKYIKWKNDYYLNKNKNQIGQLKLNLEKYKYKNE